jgi:hypothetical protein
MTFFRKHMMLVVGGGIALVLLLLTGFLVLRFSGEYSRVENELQNSQAALNRLQARNPFPSPENVERVQDRRSELQHYLGDLLEGMSVAQVRPEPIERAAFPSDLDRASRRLRQVAVEHQVRLAPGLAFGFERYGAGNLPMQEHVARLVVQLRTLEALVGVILRNGATELISVEREVFDVERAQEGIVEPVRRRPGADLVAAPATVVDPRGVPGLFTKEVFTITFSGTDPGVREVINQLVASPMITVIRRLELRSDLALGTTSPAAQLSERLRPRDTGRQPGQVPVAADAPEDRIIAGRERVRVTMQVEVYSFEQGAWPEEGS